MKKYVLISILVLISISAHADKIGIYPIDCGPLDRGEYSIVFKIDKFPKGQTYFSKGKASKLCPKLLSGNLISGYEAKLPESKLFSESERVVIKEFIITGFGKK